MHPLRSSLLLVLFAFLPLTAAAQTGSIPATPAPAVPEAWRSVSADGPWVVRLDVDSPEAAGRISQDIDLWGLDPETRQWVAQITEPEAAFLRRQGYIPIFDVARTELLSGLGVALENQGGGIPGFPCYRTVEETFATAEAIVAENPGLAEWIDVGDSWEKTLDPNDGYDLFVLKLTQSAIGGDKPVFFANFAIHAREYTTAELGTRFAEFLVGGYGIDPDITWLLDHHEVHLMLQANPDGRKEAETGLSWRKNVNNDYCSNTTSRGADLNRNFEYEWNCCGGSSGSQCSPVYRGPTAASEPEIQALQAYVRSIFPDQRGDGNDDPAPDDATGVAVDVHSFGGLVIWPWGFTSNLTPNNTAFATLGRKLAFFNNYAPLPISQFTIADGSSADFFYGDLGIAGFGYELGNDFFESCTSFENNVVGPNIESLFFGAKVARTPYLTPAGPEAMDAEALPHMVQPGDFVLLTATLDDTRFNNSNGTEPTQVIASAEAFIGAPPWSIGSVPLAMTATDGTFDAAVEEVQVAFDTTGLPPGQHLLYVQGTDTDGNVGVVTAAFLEVIAPVGIFGDGFESGNTSAWSNAVP